MRMSVALVTRNRPQSLERTLRSLRRQDAQPWEVVVSDDSDDETAGAVRSLAERFECRYVRGPRRGLYANRNHVALACGGTHIRTMDDDHEFPPGHIAACLESAREDPDAIWIIGERVPGEPAEVGARCPPQLHPRGFSVTPPPGRPIWSISDGAAIYPRTIFDAGTRFEEAFPFGASYLEWGSRLHWIGYRIRHLSSTHVVHHLDPDRRSYSDPTIDLSARFFAMFSHAFLYQPSPRARALCLLEVGKQVLLRPYTAVRSARDGWRAYRRNRERAIRQRLAQEPGAAG